MVSNEARKARCVTVVGWLIQLWWWCREMVQSHGSKLDNSEGNAYPAYPIAT